MLEQTVSVQVSGNELSVDVGIEIEGDTLEVSIDILEIRNHYGAVLPKCNDLHGKACEKVRKYLLHGTRLSAYSFDPIDEGIALLIDE